MWSIGSTVAGSVQDAPSNVIASPPESTATHMVGEPHETDIVPPTGSTSPHCAQVPSTNGIAVPVLVSAMQKLVDRQSTDGT